MYTDRKIVIWLSNCIMIHIFRIKDVSITKWTPDWMRKQINQVHRIISKWTNCEFQGFAMIILWIMQQFIDLNTSGLD